MVKIVLLVAPSLVEDVAKRVEGPVEVLPWGSPVDPGSYDVVGVVGTDKFIISVLHRLGDKLTMPLLTVGFGMGFLNSVDLVGLRDAVKHVLEGDYTTEELMRLKAHVGDGDLPGAINEIAVFPTKSATTMEYSLYVNGELLWHDVADGVIVATPTGSTAYAMSAGGPLLHAKARVYEVVPVNSINLARRPVVVPEEAVVAIRDLISRSRVEVVIDGSIRSGVGREVRISRGSPINIIRIGDRSGTVGRYEKKVMLSANMDIPPSAKLILKVLEYEGALTRGEIAEKTMLSSRTVRAALALLLKRGLVRRSYMVRNGRETVVYALAPSVAGNSLSNR